MAKTMTEAFVRQPLRGVAELIAADIPSEPGIYAWYRDGTLFYVGESRRGLRSRLWGNHLRGNARSSTLRNKVAKSFGFPAIGLENMVQRQSRRSAQSSASAGSGSWPFQSTRSLRRNQISLASSTRR
jgi:GIY-YIG catalytic domain